ncbi:MAG TPA: HEPN domain-containing protein [Flavobacteriaceae bacterium]
MKSELPERTQPIKDRIALIVEEILSVAKDKIAKIILFGSYANGTWVDDKYVEGHITYTYQSDLDILLIMRKGKYSYSKALNIEERIDKQLKKKNLEDNPWVTLIIESIGLVNKQLEQGQYFFSDIKKEGILLYDSGEYQLSKVKELGKDERRNIAQNDYDYWFHKGSGFLIDAGNAFERNDYSLTAFYLHQATESFYHTILLVFSGYKPKLHDIRKLGCMISHYHDDLLKIFPFDLPEQKKCFKLLRAAYIEARYNKDYIISKTQLEYLIERVEKLKMVTERICLSEIKK